MKQKFSERTGYKSIRSTIQKEFIGPELKNALWNGITIFFLDSFGSWESDTRSELKILKKRIWMYYFNERIDELESRNGPFLNFLKDYFFRATWFEIYDLIEFIIDNYEPSYNDGIKVKFVSYLNSTLGSHLSAYRIIDGVVTEITSEEEIKSIETATSISDKYKTVKTHLNRALELLSDKTNPDFRNSIKESISSIESLCCLITGNSSATFGQALKEIEKKYKLHGALKNSFSNLYGYTSDSDGIRHALLDEEKLQIEDAIFMLVSCSAFINYLLMKIEK